MKCFYQRIRFRWSKRRKCHEDSRHQQFPLTHALTPENLHHALWPLFLQRHPPFRPRYPLQQPWPLHKTRPGSTQPLLGVFSNEGFLQIFSYVFLCYMKPVGGWCSEAESGRKEECSWGYPLDVPCSFLNADPQLCTVLLIEIPASRAGLGQYIIVNIAGSRLNICEQGLARSVHYR